MIEFVEKNVTSYNRTFKSFRKTFYPKNYDEVKKILKSARDKKTKILVKSGGCGHGDKTNLDNSDLIISLEKINKIKNFDRRKLTITAQSGINLYSLFEILKNKNLTILNIPGGKNVSLGGAIAGNVHGRPQMKNFAVFGDNIISLKVMLESGKIIKLSKKNKLFYKMIGGLSLFGIILEAKIKLKKINNKKILKQRELVNNKKEFQKLYNKNNNFYGYIDFFKKNKFEGIFFTFKESNLNEKKESKNKIKLTLQDLLHFFRLTSLSSLFINKISLKIFYFCLFLFYKTFPKVNKINIVNFENSIYFIDLNKYLPFYFRKGMIEIQFSVPNNKIFYVINKIKSLFYSSGIYPFFFIVKKLEKSKKNYIFNFPKNNLCISVGFSKQNYLQKKDFFPIFYSFLFSNNCNVYVTKDETFLENTKNKKIRQKIKKNIAKCSNLISSDFKEKILN